MNMGSPEVREPPEQGDLQGAWRGQHPFPPLAGQEGALTDRLGLSQGLQSQAEKLSYKPGFWQGAQHEATSAHQLEDPPRLPGSAWLRNP